MRINSPVKLAKEGSKKGVGADQNGVTSVCRSCRSFFPVDIAAEKNE